MSHSSICLFAYNRPWHTQQTVSSLLKNPEASSSQLFVFSDGLKNCDDKESVRQVRRFIHAITGFKSVDIFESESNKGLARSVIDGVTSIVNAHGRIIVLEDDMLVSPHFLNYMNRGLALYQEDPQVASIHGYVYPLKNSDTLPETFFLRGADCWGWATWKSRWAQFNSDGKALLQAIGRQRSKKLFTFKNSYPYLKMLERQVQGEIDSWAIRWYASAFLNNMLTLYPARTLVRNIGLDNSGTHCSRTERFDSELNDEPIALERQPREESPAARKAFEQYFKSL